MGFKHDIYHSLPENLQPIAERLYDTSVDLSRIVQWSLLYEGFERDLVSNLTREELQERANRLWTYGAEETYYIDVPYRKVSEITHDEVVRRLAEMRRAPESYIWRDLLARRLYPEYRSEIDIGRISLARDIGVGPDISDLNDRTRTEMSYTVRGKQPFVAELEDAVLYGPYALNLTRDGEFVMEQQGDRIRNLVNLFYKTLEQMGRLRTGMMLRNPPVDPSSRNVDAEFDVAVTLVTRRLKNVNGGRTEPAPPARAINYCHWLNEELPKLRGIEYYAKRTGQKPTLVIDPEPNLWVVESLKLCGYDQDDWVEWNDSLATVDKLVVPNKKIFGSLSEPSTTNYKWVADRILRNIGDDVASREYPARIWISRSGTDRRNVVNESEVLDALRPLGFEKVLPENYSVAEQAAMFDGAEILVGPYGSGFTNVVFSDDVSIVKVNPADFFGIQEYERETLLGNKYVQLYGERVHETNHLPVWDQDIYIHPDEIVDALETTVDL